MIRSPKENILLFHSRFAFGDRLATEERTMKTFGKESISCERYGKIVIATQVVEQSLDLDFDEMVSDLAPINLLIQRTGRLQRHIRDTAGNRKVNLPDERNLPGLYVLAPKWQPDAQENWLGEELRMIGLVYKDQAYLWRTQALLREYGNITLPENIRLLIDGVYEQKINVPASLQAFSDPEYGNILSQKCIASQNLLDRNCSYDLLANNLARIMKRNFPRVCVKRV